MDIYDNLDNSNAPISPGCAQKLGFEQILGILRFWYILTLLLLTRRGLVSYNFMMLFN
jgi:hypothetical protein